MKIKIFNWPLTIDILTVLLLIVVIFVPSSVVRIIIGLPFLLFFPGFLFVTVLFPLNKRQLTNGKIELDHNLDTHPKKNEKGKTDHIKRMILSFVMSIIIVTLIGLALNYTPFGISLRSVLFSTSAFIFIMSGVVFLRESQSRGRHHLTVDLHLKLPGWHGGVLNRILTVIIVVAILGTSGALAYTIEVAKVGEKFTEFYILGNDGKAQGYPSIFLMKDGLVVGVQYDNNQIATFDGFGRATLGIVNHEQQYTSYSVTLTIDDQPAKILYAGNTFDQLQQIDLSQDGKWEQEIGFVPFKTGDNQKVEFLLYKNGEVEPNGILHLWINVNEQ